MMSERLDPDVAWLMNEVVDDLVKYSILSFLYDNPGFRGDGRALADAVGLAASPRFLRAAEELASAGVGLRSQFEDGPPAFAAALSTEHREAVGKLVTLPADSPQFAAVMRRLVTQSLRRVSRQFLEEDWA